jgi:hypothetical protein
VNINIFRLGWCGLEAVAGFWRRGRCRLLAVREISSSRKAATATTTTDEMTNEKCRALTTR